MEAERKSEWVMIPSKDINKPERIYKDGAGFQFMISPSDIPVAYRMVMESGAKPVQYVIEFKYLSGPEERKTVAHKDGVTLEVGKLSQKIYKVMIDLAVAAKAEGRTSYKLEFVVPVLEHSVEAFEHEGALRTGNADAVKRVIKIGNNLVHSMVAG